MSATDTSTASTGENIENLPPPTIPLSLAAFNGDVEKVSELLSEGAELTTQDEHGRSALMFAAYNGHEQVVSILLDNGAAWNACDNRGRCAGNFALMRGHQNCVDRLVYAGVSAELIFKAIGRRSALYPEKIKMDLNEEEITALLKSQGHTDEEIEASLKASEKPQTQPTESNGPSELSADYLNSNIRYTQDGEKLVDDQNRGVMMQWETPLMEAHAKLMCGEDASQKRVLNVGFGMGIIDTFLQAHQPKEHVIIEAHPQVYAKALADGWDKKPGVKIVHGRWQDVIHTLGEFDAIFFDTFGEGDAEMDMFHQNLPQILKSDGVYSWFNGVCPDNIFFQGVACELFKTELAEIGFQTEFVSQPIDVSDPEMWKGTNFKYFHHNTYFMPAVRRAAAPQLI